MERTRTVSIAAILILTSGALDIAWGVSALSQHRYFDEAGLLFSTLDTWGWVYIVLGVMQLAIGWLVVRGAGWGYALGMFGAFLAIFVNFLSVGAYPVWSVLLMALNFFIFFALATNA